MQSPVQSPAAQDAELQAEVTRLKAALADLQTHLTDLQSTNKTKTTETIKTEKKVAVDVASSDDDSDEDEEIDLERDENGNYVIFKVSKRTDDNDAEEEEELSEKFMALKPTKQIQILLVTLKTAIYNAQEQTVKVEYLKKQYGDIAQRLNQARHQLQTRETQLATKLKELEDIKESLFQKDSALKMQASENMHNSERFIDSDKTKGEQITKLGAIAEALR